MPHPHQPHTHHSHGHHHHETPDVSDRVLLWTVIVNFGLSGFEFVAGTVSGSVALMADALHNTNDAAALLIAYIARKVSRKSADPTYTFGYQRAELIGALIQLTALILVSLYLIIEALNRFWNPEPLHGLWIIVAAGIALLVDVVTAWLLWAMSKGSLNVKAAFLHNLTDAGASLVVLLGGVGIWLWDIVWIDPVLSLMIAGVILKMSWGMMRESIAILMEAKPKNVDLQKLKEQVEAVEQVLELHHIHVWQLDEKRYAFEGHIVVDECIAFADLEQLKIQIKSILAEDYAIEHSTLEFESTKHDCAATAFCPPE